MPKLPKRLAIRDYKNNIAYIPLGRYISHGFTIIDLDEADRIEQYYWHTDTNGYPISGTGLKRGKGNHYLHKFICPVREGFVTDHINRDVKDNRKSNLREATQRENMQNKVAYNTPNRTSKYKGVYHMTRYSETQKFGRRAYYSWEFAFYSQDIPKGVIRGTTTTEEEAAVKYNELAIKYQGDRAVLNVIE